MRLIGRISLGALLEGADQALRAAVLALHSELEAAEWRSVEDAAGAFPFAIREGRRLVIDLDGRHSVAIVVNIEAEVAVIEYAGLEADRVPPRRRRTGRS